jgi:hypothetical protein
VLFQFLMRQCLFCDNQAKSREHIWPEWILERLKVTEGINHQIGSSPSMFLDNPELKVKAVCKTCNEGRMSALESSNIPLIGNLMQDVALSLNGLQQYTISMWATKMAMVGEFMSRSHRPMFFSKADCEQLRVASNLPARTTIWLARHSFPRHIGFWGTDAWSLDKSIHAYVSTVLVGHLAIQSVTLHVSVEHEAKAVDVDPKAVARPWSEMLVSIWPTTVSATWPPQHGFRDKGESSIMKLVRRYSYGENVL